jgi:hypothetical protein
MDIAGNRYSGHRVAVAVDKPDMDIDIAFDREDWAERGRRFVPSGMELR